MFFSIIIPTYNSEDKIITCLENLINQSFSDFEILVINDGSTDNTMIVVNKFISEHPNHNIKLYNIKNQGPGMARNYGIKHAQGQYIWFIDDDDSLFDDNSLLKVQDELTTFGFPDIMIFNIVEVRGSKERKYYFTHKSYTTDIYKTPDLLLKQQWPWCKIINREFLIETEVKFPALYIFEDIYFFTDLYLQAKKISLSPNFYYKYIKNSNSLTGSLRNFRKYPNALWYEISIYLKIITKMIDR